LWSRIDATAVRHRGHRVDPPGFRPPALLYAPFTREPIVSHNSDEITQSHAKHEPGSPQALGNTVSTHESAGSSLSDVGHAAFSSTKGADANDGFILSPSDVPVIVPGYVVLGELGRGGMGVVYKARHEKLNRFAALKFVRGARARSESSQIRFLAEAEAMAAVRHRNVVQIYEFGEREGNLFLVLEYLPGGSLADKLKDGHRLGARESAGIVLQVARGVAAAHAAGIVHRDLKPGNILFDNDGTPKLADFGLAKRAASELTATLAVMGTPAYMAPEQAGGRAKFVGPPADVWALGVVLYECFTGTRPFEGSSTSEVLAGILSADPAPIPADLRTKPRELQLILRKCLEKNPADRYPTAEELADDLERFLEGKPISVRPIGFTIRACRWVLRNPAVAGLTGFALFTLAVVPPAALIYHERLSTAEQLADAHERTEAEARRAENQARRAELEARQAATTTEYFHLLSRVQRNATEPRSGWSWDAITDLQRAAGFTSLPARDLVELRTAAAGCLGSPDIREIRVAAKGYATFAVAFRPDGKQCAVCELKAWAGCRVFLIDPETGNTTRELSFTGLPVRSSSGGGFAQDGGRRMAYSPDGRFLFVGCRSGHFRRWDLSNPAAPSVGWLAHKKEISGIAFDDAGKSVYTASSDGTVKRWAIEGNGELLAQLDAEGKVDTSGLKYVAEPSPRVYFGRHGVQAATADTLTLLPDATIQSSGAIRCVPTSPHLLLTDGKTGLASWDLSTGHPGRDFSDPELNQLANRGHTRAAVSADGTLIATLGSAEDGMLRIWDMASGRVALRLPLGEVFGAEFSPDGRRLVVTARGRVLIYEVRREAAFSTVAPQALEVRTFGIRPNGTVVTLASSHHIEVAGHTRNVVTEWPGNGITPRHLYAPPRPLHEVSYGMSTFSGGLAFSGIFFGIDLDFDAGAISIPGIRLPEAFGSRYAFQTDRNGNRIWIVQGDKLTAIQLTSRKVVGSWRNGLSEVTSGLAGLESVDVGERWVVVGGRDGMTRLFHNTNPAEGAEIRPVKEWSSHYGPLGAIALNQQESLVAVGSHNG
jgi:serine/threonine protein kinase/WD40 repeat protein